MEMCVSKDWMIIHQEYHRHHFCMACEVTLIPIRLPNFMSLLLRLILCSERNRCIKFKKSKDFYRICIRVTASQFSRDSSNLGLLSYCNFNSAPLSPIKMFQLDKNYCLKPNLIHSQFLFPRSNYFQHV